jgi:hypothetical protein
MSMCGEEEIQSVGKAPAGCQVDIGTGSLDEHLSRACSMAKHNMEGQV